MPFHIKDFVSGLGVKIKSTPDGANGEVPHHHVDSSALPAGAATAARQDMKIAALGAPSDTEAAANGSIIAILKRLRTLLGGTLAVSGPLTNDELRAGALLVSGPATDAQLRAAPLAVSLAADTDVIGGVVPQMGSGGNLSATTAVTGTNWTAFASQACKQLTLINDSGTKIEFRQGGAGTAVTVFDQATFPIFGITNANQIEVRRKDTSNTQVVVAARWEA